MAGTWGLPSYLLDLLQLVIILEEEGQVHEGHIHVTVAPKLPVLLDGVSAPGKRMLVDLHRQEDTEMLVAPGHPACGHWLGAAWSGH